MIFRDGNKKSTYKTENKTETREISNIETVAQKKQMATKQAV